MGRTTKKGKRAPPKAPQASTSKPTYTPVELLHQAAALISSSEYESAKTTCQEAVSLAEQNEDKRSLMEALEILGTVELELGELDNAREVSYWLRRDLFWKRLVNTLCRV